MAKWLKLYAIYTVSRKKAALKYVEVICLTIIEILAIINW